MAICLNEKARAINFSAMAQNESNPKARVRAIILNAVKEGRNKTEIADIVGVHRVTVSATITRVNEAGEAGLHDKYRAGRTPRMNAEQEQIFLQKFNQEWKEKKGGRLTGYDAKRILNDMGFKYKLSRVYDILHKLELAWITSRSQHPNANEVEQENFKKTSHKK